MAGLLLLLPLLVLLAPYLFLGKSMVPLEMLAIFEPWSSHPEVFGERPPDVWNPLLDSLQQYYPRRIHFHRSLGEGFIPLWDPYVYGGSSFAGMQQGATLYPPAYLLAILPAALQFGISAFVHLGIALLGGFAFFRRVGLGVPASATGALALGLNGFSLVWLAYPNVTQWTLCWVPVAFYCFERARASTGPRWPALCGAALALMLLGGHGQSSAYGLMAWTAWALWRTLPARNLRSIGLLVILPLGLALALSAGQWLPALDYLPRTDRGTRLPWENIESAAMPWSQLWTWLIPRLFGDGTAGFAYLFWMPEGGRAGLTFAERSAYPGITVLGLALGSLTFLRMKGETGTLARFGWLMIVAGLLLAAATPLYWPLWRWAPGFGHFTAVGRILWLTAPGFACCAAAAVQRLSEPDEKDSPALLGLVVAPAVLALAAAVAWFIYGEAIPQQVEQAAAALGRTPASDTIRLSAIVAVLAAALTSLVAFLARRPVLAGGRRGTWSSPLWHAVAVVALVAFDLTWFGLGYNPAADPSLAKARTPEIERLNEVREPFRMLSIRPPDAAPEPRGRMPSNLPGAFGWGDLRGSDSFVPVRYREWESALAEANGGQPWAGPYSPAFQAASVRFYLPGHDSAPEGSARLLAPRLQEDSRALPYARWHGSHVVEPDPARLLPLVTSPTRDPRVLVSGSGSMLEEGVPTITALRSQREGPNRIRLDGQIPAAGMAAVSEGWDPGWRARVNGRPQRLVPVEHRLLGLPVAAGPVEIELSYEPDAWRCGLWLSFLGTAILAALAVSGQGAGRPPASPPTPPGGQGSNGGHGQGSRVPASVGPPPSRSGSAAAAPRPRRRRRADR